MPERTANEPKRGRHSHNEGNAIGLTEAFMPLDDGFEDDAPARSWFDDDDDQDADGFARGNITVFDDEFDEDEDFEEDDSDDDVPVKIGRHARHAKPSDQPDATEDVANADVGDGAMALPSAGKHSSRRRGKRNPDEVPAYMRKSRRTRNMLLVALTLLVILCIAGGALVVKLVETAQSAADEQVSQNAPATSELQTEASDDATTVTAKKVSAPDLLGLLGLSVDAALEQLGKGAQLTSSVELNAEGERLGEGETLAYTENTVSLTSCASDSRMGYPSVYLTCDAKGKVVRAGFSATTTLLGFGSQSFEDVISNGHIIEATLGEAGVSVGQGSVALPSDKSEYTTYTSDGTTPSMEYCSFSGTSQVEDGEVEWSAVLSYDYTMYNVTGNLTDTVRVIYVYVE